MMAAKTLARAEGASPSAMRAKWASKCLAEAKVHPASWGDWGGVGSGGVQGSCALASPVPPPQSPRRSPLWGFGLPARLPQTGRGACRALLLPLLPLLLQAGPVLAGRGRRALPPPA